MNKEQLSTKISTLPTQSGVYKFLDENDTIIYVGKAKNIKKRVASYFTNSKQHSRKTLMLVSMIRNIDVVIAPTELDALLLENSLIKENQPKYNILLKDGKTYPFICITKEPFPRVIVTRRPKKIKGKFFGPYSNVKAMNNLLELIKAIFQIRSCTYHLSEQNIQNQKYKVCLEYHIKNCKGGCEGLQDEKEYLEDIRQIEEILKGKTRELADYFKAMMLEYAEELAFEKAQEYKERLEKLTIFRNKSIVVKTNISSLLILTISTHDNLAFLNFLYLFEGSIIHAETFEVEKRLEEKDADIFLISFLNIIEKYKITKAEVLSNIEINVEIPKFTFALPKIGDKRNLVEMSLKNVRFAKMDRLKKKEENKKIAKQNIAVETLQKDLNMQDLPNHIECFDNSNLQGTNPVAAMVCFKNGKPSKKDYRHFKIKTVEGPDDFASMYEIVYRRYKRLKDEALPFPQLIIIDGGKGQLSSACQALKDLELFGKMAIIGIAKKLEEIYFPGDSIPLHISKKSEGLKLIQRLRNEAHRFAITFHRDLRSKNSIQSSLESIEGFGPKTIEKLLKHFKTIKNLKSAEPSELEEVIGKAKTQKLLDFYKD